jgi:hypothetical protein
VERETDMTDNNRQPMANGAVALMVGSFIASFLAFCMGFAQLGSDVMLPIGLDCGTVMNPSGGGFLSECQAELARHETLGILAFVLAAVLIGTAITVYAVWAVRRKR